MPKRKRSEVEAPEVDSEEENPWTVEDLGLPERQAAALRGRSSDHQKHLLKWAKRFENFRSDPSHPEYVRESAIGDDAALDFLTHLVTSEKYAPTSIQTFFSYIRTYFALKYNVRDGKNVYVASQQYLNRAKEGYTPTKAPSFDSIGPKCLVEYWKVDHSTSNRTLLRKVVSLCGVFGVERGMELHKTLVDDVMICDDVVEITVRRCKGDKATQTVLIPNLRDVNIVEIFRDYIDWTASVRVPGLPSRFFQQLHANGNFMNANVGKNYMGTVARGIAEELNYANFGKFSGHSFRATAATTMFENGATKEQIKIAGNWKSDRVMEGYIRDTKRFKLQQASFVAGDQTITDNSTDDSMNLSITVSEVSDNSMTVSESASCTSRRTLRQNLTIFGHSCNLSNFSGTLNVTITGETAKVSACDVGPEDNSQIPPC